MSSSAKQRMSASIPAHPGKKRAWLVHVLLPLVVGFAIYLLRRPADLQMFRWLDWFGLSPAFRWIRDFARPVREYVPDWVLHSLPNGCAAYALVAALFIIWGRGGDRGRNSWFVMAVLLIMASEIGQAFDWVSGYFSWLDLVCDAVGILAAWGALRQNQEIESCT